MRASNPFYSQSDGHSRKFVQKFTNSLENLDMTRLSKVSYRRKSAEFQRFLREKFLSMAKFVINITNIENSHGCAIDRSLSTEQRARHVI